MASSSQVHDSGNEEDGRRYLNEYMDLYRALLEGDMDRAARTLSQDPFTSQPSASVDASALQQLIDADLQRVRELNRYTALYKAALKGDWEAARAIFHSDPAAVTAKITSDLKMTLHVVVGTGEKAIGFTKNLLELMPSEAVEWKDDNDETALSVAAIVGNLKAAKLLVDRSPTLPYIRDKDGVVPLHRAVLHAHRDLVDYLLQVTRDDVQPSPYADECGVKLLWLLVLTGFYNLAVELVQKYPLMARKQIFGDKSPLSVLAGEPSVFPSGICFNFWQRLLYNSIPQRSMESQTQGLICSRLSTSKGFQKLHNIIWGVAEKLVPSMKHIRDTKAKHNQVLKLVKLLCKEAAELNYIDGCQMLRLPLLLAATYGIPEIVEEINEALPHALRYSDGESRNMFMIAVVNRRENVFNLLFQMTNRKEYMIQGTDVHGNSILHLAGKLAPPHRLSVVSGAALQMQRELQWFKEVEKFVQPALRNTFNKDHKTPAMVFSEEHKELIKEGEQWMKDTANSCTVAATLIATVVFAAAITVPGGNNGDTGLPIFSSRKPFIIFAVADALSLFSSTAAILMFMSILTARYAEPDFLSSLPSKLIVGLVSLFISITSMMVAFSATLYIVFGDENQWLLISIAASAGVLVILFLSLQFRLIVDMISSTYGPCSWTMADFRRNYSWLWISTSTGSQHETLNILSIHCFRVRSFLQIKKVEREEPLTCFLCLQTQQVSLLI